MGGRTMKVVLSGFYGFGNMGDEAILQSIIDNLRLRWPDIEITVFSFSPEETGQKHSVQSLYRGWRRETIKKIRALREADVLISGGGGLLQDAYATGIISGPLPYYLLIVLLAKLCGTPVMFFSQGIGPITSRYGKFLVRKIANKADLITVRDKESKELLRALGVLKPEIIVTADIVFALRTDRAPLPAVSEGPLNRPGKWVAVSVRPWFEQKDYLKQIGRALDLLMETHHVTPVFFPMEGDYDYRAAEEVVRQMKNGNRSVLLKPGYSPEEMIGLLKKCQLTIGMRLHSLIFSCLAEIPYIGIVYDPKVENFLKATDMQAFAIAMNNIQPDRIVERYQYIINHEEEIGERIKQKKSELGREALKNITLLEQYFLTESVGEKREHTASNHI